jgi:hypothetical protein
MGRLASDCELSGFGGDDGGGEGYGAVTWELALGLRHGALLLLIWCGM